MILHEYLKKEAIPVQKFAEEIDVSSQAVYRYIAGARVPKRSIMQRISAVTKGSVTPNDFMVSSVDLIP